MSQPRHFLDLKDHTSKVLRDIIDQAHRMKSERREGGRLVNQPLKGKMLAMIFDKPSTRTRVSFDVGMRELGGETIYLSGSEMQLGRGESVSDTAKVLSRYVDAIMIRTTDHTRLIELAESASIPVINGLTDDSHPCQIMADVMTFEEHRGAIAGKKLAWTGDGNNVLTSLIHAAGRFDFELSVATPAELQPTQEVMAWARGENVSISLTSDPREAVAMADCVITDTFVSMGDDDNDKRHELLMPYQVNDVLMAEAKKDAIFMHCLPAHREEEVTASVMDGLQSVVFDEAENRLHAQKSILAYCLGAGN